MIEQKCSGYNPVITACKHAHNPSKASRNSGKASIFDRLLYYDASNGYQSISAIRSIEICKIADLISFRSPFEAQFIISSGRAPKKFHHCYPAFKVRFFERFNTGSNLYLPFSRHHGGSLRSPHALHLPTPAPERLSQLLPKSRPLRPQIQRHGRRPAFLHLGAIRTSM